MKKFKHTRTCMTTIIFIFLLIVAVDISNSRAKTFTPPESVVKSLPFNNQNDSKYTESEQRVASKIEINEGQKENNQNKIQSESASDKEKPEVKSSNSTPTPSPLTNPDEQRQATNEADTIDILTPTPTAQVSKTPTPAKNNSDSSCIETGGVWRGFPNSCVDSCILAENPQIMCLQVITEGCDCGPEKCWDRETNSCVANPSGSKIISPTIQVPPPTR